MSSELEVLARLDEPPHGPHRMRGRAPDTHLRFQTSRLSIQVELVPVRGALHGAVRRRTRAVGAGSTRRVSACPWCIGRREWRACVREVRSVEGEPLFLGRVANTIKQVGRITVIVGSPLVEVVCDVKGCGIWRCIFKINDNDLSSWSKIDTILYKL